MQPEQWGRSAFVDLVPVISVSFSVWQLPMDKMLRTCFRKSNEAQCSSSFLFEILSKFRGLGNESLYADCVE